MSTQQTDKDTERFYKLSYLIIPIPLVLGLIFAVYVLATEDSRNLSFCTTAANESAYAKQPLQAQDFKTYEAISLNLCKDKDDLIDDSDGRTLGKVRWFICKGTVCGPGWETFLSRH